MEMEPGDYEIYGEDEEQASSFMRYLLLEISSKIYVKQYNRVYSVFLLFNDQYFLLSLTKLLVFGQPRQNIYNFNTGAA